MRSFLLSLALLAVAVTLILCNAAYILRLSNDLLGQVSALPAPDSDDCEAALGRLEAFWARHRGMVGLTVNDRLIEQISEEIALLGVHARNGAAREYEVERMRLHHALMQLRELEQLCLSHVL